jgi:hypothetical protein
LARRFVLFLRRCVSDIPSLENSQGDRYSAMCNPFGFACSRDVLGCDAEVLIVSWEHALLIGILSILSNRTSCIC